MNGWEIFGIVVAAIAILLFLMNVKDLYRYIKISNM
jgi:hypothetical protein